MFLDKFAKPGDEDFGNILGATKSLKNEIEQSGAAWVHPGYHGYSVALESALGDPAAGVEVRRSHETLLKTVKETFKKAGINTDKVTPEKAGELVPRWKERFTNAQWQAGAIVAGQVGNALAYMQRACAMESLDPKPGMANFNLIGSNADYDYQLKNIALENFDSRTLEDFMAFSITYNVQGARQDEAGEALYPTVVMTPDQTGLEISIRRVQVHNEIRHSSTGKPTDFNRVNLIDAVRDFRVLANNTTEALPIFITGDAENNSYFSSDVTPYTKKIQGVDKLTAPLKPGIEIGLLGLANLAQVQPNGTLDQWDSLDLRLTLDKIYIKFTNASTSATSVIPIPTKRLPYTNYYGAYEGLSDDVNLNFISKVLPLRGTTKDVAGVAAANLVYFTDPARVNWVVQIGVQMNGRANLGFGNVSATPGTVTVEAVLNKNPDGTYTKINDPAILTAVKAELGTISVVGYDLGAFRSNLNRRTLGIITTVTPQRERHIIPLGAPITCASPLTNTATNTDVAAPISATRIRNSNNAITKLLDYAEQLDQLVVAYDYSLPIPQIEGIGGNLIKPYFKKSTFDVFAKVNSIKSQDRAADVSAALINKIRAEAYRAYVRSNYQPALDAETAQVGETPQLIILTDPETARHLLVSGDTRTASIGFDFQIVTSQDYRIVDKIFVTFARKGQQGIDPLSFGFMAWIPELATNLPITRNGGTTQEIQVQPRTLHVNTLPLLVQIDVQNLSAAVSESINIPFKEIA